VALTKAEEERLKELEAIRDAPDDYCVRIMDGRTGRDVWLYGDAAHEYVEQHAQELAPIDVEEDEEGVEEQPKGRKGKKTEEDEEEPGPEPRRRNVLTRGYGDE
jgi:hypothetical protein